MPTRHSIERSSGRRTPWALLSCFLIAWLVTGCGPEVEADAAPERDATDERAAGERAEETLAFVGVNVIPMDRERVLEDQVVILRGERIEQLGPADRTDVPDDARVIEARGQWMIPGLAEMHAHIPPEGGRDWMEDVLFLYLARGITTVRGMLGQPLHLELREAVESGELLGPRIYTSGPSLNASSIPDPDSARRAVRYQAAEGYDFLKIHPGLTRASYDAIAQAADSAGIRWAGHVPADVGLDRALEVRQASIDHLDQYMEALVPDDADTDDLEPLFFGVHLVESVELERMPEVARATREAGVWNVPTQSLIERILLPGDPEEMARQPEMRYMPRETVENWIQAKRRFLSHPSWSAERAERFVELRRRLIGALHEAGAPILLGSDAPQIFQVPGFSIVPELRMTVASGLSPYEALETGTTNVARYFGAAEERGTVEAGKVADLVLLEANPLEDIENVGRIAGVVVRGQWLPAEEIQSRLDAIASARGEDD